VIARNDQPRLRQALQEKLCRAELRTPGALCEIPRNDDKIRRHPPRRLQHRLD
jgi:hypothetical protein